MKIAAYLIVKNEEKTIQRCLDSCQDFDEIVICDTGSSDGTWRIINEWFENKLDKIAFKAFFISVQPWRFDDARNTALNLVSGDVDVCISIDADEVMMPGWRAEVEKYWQKDTTRMSYKFDWSNGIVFYSDKIHSRCGYRWVKPCHEALKLDPRIEERFAFSPELLIKHLPDPTKSRGSYLPLLELSYKETPDDHRTLIYLAREYTYYGRQAEAIPLLEKYLELSTWDTEKSYAHRLLGDAYLATDREKSKFHYRKACETKLDHRDGWVSRAQFYHDEQNWLLCLNYAEKALSITERTMDYCVDPINWGWKPYDLAALAAFNLGDKDKAVEYGGNALRLAPTDERLKANFEFYKNMPE